METIKWVAPPPVDRRPKGRKPNADVARINRIAEELKANPGQWALVAENVAPGNRDPWINRGLTVRLHHRRDYEHGKHDIYARYEEKTTNE